MGAIQRSQVQSVEYSGNKNFQVDSRRNYFFVVMGAASGTIEFGGGGGKIPLPAGQYFEPLTVPTSNFVIETSGSFILMTVASTHATAT